jgi:hypothetical protein
MSMPTRSPSSLSSPKERDLTATGSGSVGAGFDSATVGFDLVARHQRTRFSDDERANLAQPGKENFCLLDFRGL